MTSAVKSKKKPTVPKPMESWYAGFTELTDAFCRKHLNDEYAVLCQELVAALCRKRPSPLFQGTVSVWAAGIVYTLGGANFLHDPSMTPHLKLSDIGPHFGVSASATASKAKQIRDIFKITQMDPRWTLPSKLAQNPLVWMIQVDGFVLDARQAPRHIQEAAFNKGLIPYIPE